MEISHQHPGEWCRSIKASLEITAHQGSVLHHGDSVISVLEANNETGQQHP